jgi:hypothetical protein
MRLRSQLGFLALLAGCALSCAVSASAGMAIYSNIPATLPTDFDFPLQYTSIGFEAYAASEFGGIIHPDYTAGNLITSATVGLSNWAYQGKYPGYGDNTGYDVPLTLTLYDVNDDGTVGAIFATAAVDAHILWRTGTTGCQSSDGSNDGYQLNGAGQCYGGDVQLVSFSFDDVEGPADFIYGLSFDTMRYGATPTSIDGPYDSLNLGLSLNAPTAGTNPAFASNSPYYDSVYWNTANAGNLSAQTAQAGFFSQDSGAVSADVGSAIVEFDAIPSPEPATSGLMGAGLLALAFAIRSRFRLQN